MGWVTEVEVILSQEDPQFCRLLLQRDNEEKHLSSIYGILCLVAVLVGRDKGEQCRFTVWGYRPIFPDCLTLCFV